MPKRPGNGPDERTKGSYAKGLASREAILADGIPGALFLALIFTALGSFTLKLPKKPPYFPKVLLLSIKHLFLVLGVLVTAGVLFQRVMGTIIAEPAEAAILVGVIAGATAVAINYLTKRSLVAEAVR